MEQIFNPYLPLTEHIPDGEPHLFNGRVYIYGSHDIAGGSRYCEDHYVTWSAPEDDLRNWRCEGVIYRRTQDPSNADDRLQLWAPDVTQGPDGRYYLYYCYSFRPEIGVAVSGSPAGPFEFYGHVKHRDGTTLTEMMPFDPAVLTDDDGRVFLYYGFAPGGDKNMGLSGPEDPERMNTGKKAKGSGLLSGITFGKNSVCVELEQDMLTCKEAPHWLIPGEWNTKGTGFEGHGFFEASSIRKIKGKYVFVYSSHKSHELCYAVSDRPDRDYVYGGTIVSNGDIGMNGQTAATNVVGNNHGGILEAGGEYYIFYHRQTNGTEFSRQGCAEKIRITDDLKISQVEITSQGLNGKALRGEGSYPAAILCYNVCPTTRTLIDYADPVMKTQTRITEAQNTVYVTDIADGSVLGYRYFDLRKTSELQLEVRGAFSGTVSVSTDAEGKTMLGAEKLTVNDDGWCIRKIRLERAGENSAVYLKFEGEGKLDLKTLIFS